MSKNLLLATPVFLVAAGLPWADASDRSEAAPPQVATLNIDGVHSSVVFNVLHAQTGYFYGRFNEFGGTVEFDEENPDKSSIDLRIKAASVDTGIGKRDDHLRSQDFFSVKEFPEIRFKSTGIKAGSKERLSVAGDLTLHGVTKSITADVEIVRVGDSPMGFRAGFRGRMVLKRSDFGMNFMLDNKALGDEIEVIVSLQAVPPRQG